MALSWTTRGSAPHRKRWWVPVLCVTAQTVAINSCWHPQEKLLALAKETRLEAKVGAMLSGSHINETEDRAVMHTALRAAADKVRAVCVFVPRLATCTPRPSPIAAPQKILVDGHDVVPDVHAVLNRIKAFTAKVRSGEWKGVTGKTLTDVVSIGIGGSYLGPEFVFEALRCGPCCVVTASAWRTLDLRVRLCCRVSTRAPCRAQRCRGCRGPSAAVPSECRPRRRDDGA